MRRLLPILILLALAGCDGFNPDMEQAHGANAEQRWAIYYGNELPASTFKRYDLVVFDRRYHPDFKKLRERTVVLAYVSIGEAHGDLPEKDVLAKQNALSQDATAWDSHVADLASPGWHEVVMKEIADARKQGFDGVMLDTVDSPIDRAAKESPAKQAKAEDDAVALIAQIRQQNPGMKIMLNRGFSILPRVAPALDYLLAESTLAQTDVSTGQSRLFPPNSYQFAVNQLDAVRLAAPWLKIYTLDYWDQDDVQGLHKIYAIQRAEGFSPYVTTPDLRRYTPEPVELTTHQAGGLKGDRDA